MGQPSKHHHGSSIGPEATAAELELVRAATAPARWLLDATANGGVALTQTHALARAVVREATERWPHWWHADLFGPPHREADVAVLEALHEGLRRLRLVRRRGRTLHATPRGRALAGDPAALLLTLASDLGCGDPFTEMVADTIIDTLASGAPCEHDQLVGPALGAARRGGWRDPAGRPPDERDVSWTVSEVLRRGEAYGLIDRPADSAQPSRYRTLIGLTDAGAMALGAARAATAAPDGAFVFDAELLAARGVGARVAVGTNEHLTALHDAIQHAFGWADDHLYSFWLDGGFWGDEATEYVRPDMPDTDQRTADVPLAELNLKPGAKIAYVFDYGDEWRVVLTLCDHIQSGAQLPRVVERRGTAPPQYPPLEDD